MTLEGQGQVPGTGTEVDWGEVLIWEPPARFVMTWHMAAAVTEVELTFTELGPALTRVPAYLAAHQERWREFAARGELLMIGPFANAQEDGAMAIFTTREAAEEFVRGDPFVLNGIVRNWYIRDWIEALVPEPLAEESG